MVFFHICTVKIPCQLTFLGADKILCHSPSTIGKDKSVCGRIGNKQRKPGALFTYHMAKTETETFFNVFLIMEDHRSDNHT